MNVLELPLPAVLDIPAATALRQQCLAALDAGQGLALMAADVEQAGTAALQVLVAAQAAAQTRCLGFACTQAAPAFIESARLLGVAELLLTER
jgi:anti-anti-sigma regulatory factor